MPCPSEADVRRTIDERIGYYQSVHRCSTPALTPDIAEDELFSALWYYYPYSAFILLCGLGWCLDHRENEYGGSSKELDAAMTAIDTVYWESDASSSWKTTAEVAERQRAEREELRRRKRKEIKQWPVEDRRAVYEWLQVATTWPVMEAENPESLSAIKAYWQKVSQNK